MESMVLLHRKQYSNMAQNLKIIYCNWAAEFYPLLPSFSLFCTLIICHVSNWKELHDVRLCCLTGSASQWKPSQKWEEALQAQVSFKNWCAPTALQDAEGSKPRQNQIKGIIITYPMLHAEMGELPFSLVSHSASNSTSQGQRHKVLTGPEMLWEDTWHRHSDKQHLYFFPNPQKYHVPGNQALSSSGTEEKSTGFVKL